MSQAPVTALLLPGYSPGLDWLARAMAAGRVVLDDLHPFSRKSQVHRAKIRTNDGYQWLTIPFPGEDRRKPVNQVRIDDRRSWLSQHLKSLEYNYRNSLYFDYYEPEIRADFAVAGDSELLIDAIRHLMHRQWTYLQLPAFPHWASEHFHHHDDLYRHIHQLTDEMFSGSLDIRKMSPPGISDPKIHSISAENARRTGFDTSLVQQIIWQEPGSRHYQKPHPAAAQPEFTHPVYRQHFPGFVPGCCMLDLLFEYGPDAWQVLDQLRGTGHPGGTS